MFNDSIDRLNDINSSFTNLKYIKSGKFTNSITDTLDQTLLIRDIQQDELGSFKNKTIKQIDNEDEIGGGVGVGTTTTTNLNKNIELCILLGIQLSELQYIKTDTIKVKSDKIYKRLLKSIELYNSNNINNYEIQRQIDIVYEKIQKLNMECVELKEVLIPEKLQELRQWYSGDHHKNKTDVKQLIQDELDDIKQLEFKINQFKQSNK
ncbi:hypothetical protein CANARDRAFT_9955 [[Candida] arabinofermentans NRRL YB-2248]|uniref:Uncharacterized protein n=1 Tax=[Candida] arabinofermentans NRRL YB-2248 TaxID=983967 RepID=A0A1E4SUJ3_9ASCO|nr:hypothetical protein CANARDRAFT_9955 [[Candida] arabinofermentans NRRL YB-2248]